MIEIDHIAIATQDVEETKKLYEELFQVEAGEIVSVPDQGVKSSVFSLGSSGLELMEPLDPENSIQKYINKHGAGIHHIAIRVDDLDQAEEEYTAKGYRLIYGTANGRKSLFIHPKSTGGVLIELCTKE